MSAREMQIALDTSVFMEEQLDMDITGDHDIFFWPDVTQDGSPYVAITVSGKNGVERLSAIFGDCVEYRGDLSKEPVQVPVVIQQIQPKNGMN